MKLVVAWQGKPAGINKKEIEKKISQSLNSKHFPGPVMLGINFVSQKKALKLNQNYRKQDYIPDVLSFPLEKELGPDGVTRLGDIVICLPTTQIKATEKILHGLEHLLGRHH